jgi:hypothetical protein
MSTRILLAVFFLAVVAQARGPRFYEKGTLTEMSSVPCGYEEKGAKGIGGVLLGTDSQRKKTSELLCQEYGLRTSHSLYRIRPKDEKHPTLLPVGEDVEFRIHKDKMLLRVPEADGKERDYLVISIMPRTDLTEAKK